MTVENLKARILPLTSLPAARPGSDPFHSHALVGLEAREQLQGELEPYLQVLAAEFPGLYASRRLYDGAWVVGVCGSLSPGRRGEPAYCRFELDLRIDVDERTATVVCHRTALRRDLATERTTLELDADGRPQRLDVLREFVEATAFAFAERLVAGGVRS